MQTDDVLKGSAMNWPHGVESAEVEALRDRIRRLENVLRNLKALLKPPEELDTALEFIDKVLDDAHPR